MGWNFITKPMVDGPKLEKENAMYTSSKFSKVRSKMSSIGLKILGIINTLNNFYIYIQNDQFTIHTNCRNIIEFYNKVKKKLKRRIFLLARSENIFRNPY